MYEDFGSIWFWFVAGKNIITWIYNNQMCECKLLPATKYEVEKV